MRGFDRLDDFEPFEFRVAPDLIITDYKMPGLNGASFIRRVRAEPALADIPIIVVTVFEDKAFRLRALDAGASDFLLSPVDPREAPPGMKVGRTCPYPSNWAVARRRKARSTGATWTLPWVPARPVLPLRKLGRGAGSISWPR
jgi:CheY-like chemotaxis protein